jgi:hypothetical protein
VTDDAPIQPLEYVRYRIQKIQYLDQDFEETNETILQTDKRNEMEIVEVIKQNTHAVELQHDTALQIQKPENYGETILYHSKVAKVLSQKSSPFRKASQKLDDATENADDESVKKFPE